MSEPSFHPPYQNLIPWDASGFPHRCSCSKEFTNLEEFLRGTTSPSEGSGLNEFFPQNESPICVWRNCSCGSTLMVLCASRRDTSHAGQLAREAFGQKLSILQNLGLSLEEARTLLLSSAANTSVV